MCNKIQRERGNKMINFIIKESSNRFGLIAKRLGLAMALMILMTALTGFSKPVSHGTEIMADSFCTNNSDHAGYQSFSDGNVTREYIIYVPTSYDNNNPTPLLINYHGWGDCAADWAETVGDFYSLNALADSENFLVAYPQGVIREKEAPEWDPGDDGGQNMNSNDNYFTAQLIADIKKEYNVDLKRVYATGYSNGGMMCYGLASHLCDQIAAVGIMSGAMFSTPSDINEYTPLIIFHGIADEVLPYEGNEWYLSASDVVDFWVTHNNIPTSSLVTTDLNGGDVVRDEYTGGNDNTSVVLYTVHEEHGKPGGHVWFSGDIDGTNPNQILWDFLSKYDIDGLITTSITTDKSIKTKHRNNISLKLTSKLIILETNFSENHNYEIFSISGKKVVEGIIDSNKKHINISNLSPNIYFLKIKNQIMKINFVELLGK